MFHSRIYICPYSTVVLFELSIHSDNITGKFRLLAYAELVKGLEDFPWLPLSIYYLIFIYSCAWI